MHATTVAIDLAKDVFELAFADAERRIERSRLNRSKFAVALDNHKPLKVVMEACGSAHYWARRFERAGHHVGHNKAAVALANKLARRLWASEHHRKSFDPNHDSVRGTPSTKN